MINMYNPSGPFFFLKVCAVCTGAQSENSCAGRADWHFKFAVRVLVTVGIQRLYAKENVDGKNEA